MRIASLWVPAFPLQALRRSVPELAEAPLVIASGPLPRDEVVAVAAEAAELGVRAGMTAAQVRQVAPTALVRVTPEAAAVAADEALADVAGSFSPHVRRHAPGETLLDVGGLVPRFGSEGTVAHELLRAARHVGLEARVGIAASVGVARVAARCAGPWVGASFASWSSLPASEGGTGGRKAAEGVRGPAGPPAPGAGAGLVPARRDDVVVRPGEERTFVASLPLSLLCAGLGPAPEIAATLARWGLTTAGELARIPRREVALRLGQEGVALHRLACGEETAAFIPDPLREVLREGVELDFPLGALEPFLFVTSGLLARLERRLELRGEGFSEVLLELHLEGGGRREHRLKLVAPTREVPAVLALIRLQLEAHPPGAAVEGVTALVTPGRVRLTQGSLFGPAMPAPGKLSTALARLAALVGPDRVGAPAVPDSHRPGAFTVRPFAPCEDRGPLSVGRRPQRRASGGRGVPTTGRGPVTTVLRAFRPPRRAQVVAVGGRPVVARVDGVGGAVVGSAGPYRFAGDWWGAEPCAREDFDVATEDGSLLRIYFDRLERQWFADGIYD
jgi:protein ImuB